MIPSRTWRRPPGRRGSGGLFIQPVGKAPIAPAVPCGVAPQSPSLVTPGDKVPKMAAVPWCPRWQPHLSATVPKMAALPQRHTGTCGPSAPCQSWR